jgi:hypothetical protein
MFGHQVVFGTHADAVPASCRPSRAAVDLTWFYCDMKGRRHGNAPGKHQENCNRCGPSMRNLDHPLNAKAHGVKS